MSVERRRKLRNGKIIESVVETPSANSSRMAEINSVDNDSSENIDVLSHFAEIREKYERIINDLQSEFSQLKDLLMAVLKKSVDDSHSTSNQSPSKQPKVGLDSPPISSLT